MPVRRYEHSKHFKQGYCFYDTQRNTVTLIVLKLTTPVPAAYAENS